MYLRIHFFIHLSVETFNFLKKALIVAAYCPLFCAGNFNPAMGARNQVGIGLSYWHASLCSFATRFQTLFLESIPRSIEGLRISTLLIR